MFDESVLKKLFKTLFKEIGIEVPKEQFPVIIRKGVNDYGKTITYYLNYSAMEQKVKYEGKDGIELLSGESIPHSGDICIKAWNLCIVEEK